MYTIHIDGNLLHSTAHEDEAHIALDVKPTLDIEGSGSLSFVLPPGNAQYNSIKKMKSIVTLHQDDELLFRGRVMDDERDFFNQKSIYCEGDRSFLLDSLWEEQTVTGNAQDLFRAMIKNHNKQVEADKRFTVGIITAVDEDEPAEGELRIETRKFWDTATMIDNRLLSVYGGYLRTRTEGDVHYIDWLKDFDEEGTQPIRFSVNLIDLKEKLDAKDVFTVLIPLGYSEIGEDGTYTDPVNIKSVNDGKEYIQDDDAVALYGKIWRTKTWGYTKSPSSLLKKAKKHLKTGTELRTLTIRAVDMHFVDGNVDMIRIGTKVQIESDPHGISLNMVCAKMDIDPDNPENTTYTFGVKPQTLSEGVIRAEKEVSTLTGSSGGGRGGGGGKSIQQEAAEILSWAKIFKDDATATIKLHTGQISEIDGRVSTAEASITLNKESIELKVSKDGVISAINQTAESVKIQASKIDLEGYVTATQLETELADMEIALAESIVTKTLHASSRIDTKAMTVESAVITDSLRFDSKNLTLQSMEVVTGVYGRATGAVGVNTIDGGQAVVITDYTVIPSKETIYYLGYSG